MMDTMEAVPAELKIWVEEAGASKGFDVFWDEAPPSARAFVLACFALADLPMRTAADRGRIYADLIASSRAALLEHLSGGRISGAAVHTIERCDAVNFQLSDWNAVLTQLEDPKTRRALSHVTHVTTTLARQLASIPVGLQLPAMFQLLLTLDVAPDHWDRIGAALGRAGPDRRTTLLRRAREVTTAADLFDLMYRCEDVALAASMAQRPRVDLGPRFQPIVGAEEMRAEGERMDNCLGRLVDRANAGVSAYFAWLDAPRATVELRAVAGTWVLGEVGGSSNRPLDPATCAEIRAAVTDALGPHAVSDPKELLGELRSEAFARCVALGRSAFSPIDREALAKDMWSLHGRSRSATQGAYLILALSDGTYFQCLADRGSTYFVELSSHRYVSTVADHLTSAMVRLLEESGFHWPRSTANFARLYRVETRDDCVELADFALGALHEMFGVRSVAGIDVTVNIPSGDTLPP